MKQKSTIFFIVNTVPPHHETQKIELKCVEHWRTVIMSQDSMMIALSIIAGNGELTTAVINNN